jgi:hypothetical protein
MRGEENAPKKCKTTLRARAIAARIEILERLLVPGTFPLQYSIQEPSHTDKNFR